MKNDRAGESLWFEWDGSEYETEFDQVFYTVDHVSLDNELVRRALASTLQRDGVSDSLGDGFKLIENSKVTFGFSGYIDKGLEMYPCDESGYTDHGDLVDEIINITLVEF